MFEKTNKKQNRVCIYTHEYVVTGFLHTLEGVRIIDELNQKSRDFLAVTDAEIITGVPAGQNKKVSFLAINKNNILLINPVEEG